MKSGAMMKIKCFIFGHKWRLIDYSESKCERCEKTKIWQYHDFLPIKYRTIARWRKAARD